jgi:hypothetical protein
MKSVSMPAQALAPGSALTFFPFAFFGFFAFFLAFFFPFFSLADALAAARKFSSCSAMLTSTCLRSSSTTPGLTTCTA